MTGALELLTVGRVSVDLYSPDLGLGWIESRSFRKSVGGSPTNVAVAAARLGRRSAVLTKVGADPFGDYVRAKLRSFGVDAGWVGTHPGLLTPLALAVLDPPEDPPLIFYREPSAPDLHIEPGDLDPQLVREVPILWVTGTGLSAEPSRATTRGFLEERDRRGTTVLDLDYRPSVWQSAAQAREEISAALGLATVAIGNRVECEIATGSSDPDTAADRLLERGISLAVVKKGRAGVLFATPDQRISIPPLEIEPLCGLGAGDAFGGALAHGLLHGWDVARLGAFANAAGAIVASRLFCSDAMPEEWEVLAALDGNPPPPPPDTIA